MKRKAKSNFDLPPLEPLKGLNLDHVHAAQCAWILCLQKWRHFWFSQRARVRSESWVVLGLMVMERQSGKRDVWTRSLLSWKSPTVLDIFGSKYGHETNKRVGCSECTLCGVQSVVKFGFVSDRKFRLPTEMHNSCIISPPTSRTCQKYYKISRLSGRLSVYFQPLTI